MPEGTSSIWLIDGDLPCLKCGKNLRGLIGQKVGCPECGHLNDLADPHQWENLFQRERYESAFEGRVLVLVGANTICIALFAMAVNAFPDLLFLVPAGCGLLYLHEICFKVIPEVIDYEYRIGSNWLQIGASIIIGHCTVIVPIAIMYQSYRMGHLYTYWVNFYIWISIFTTIGCAVVSLRVLKTPEKKATRPPWMRYCEAVRMRPTN